MNRLEKYNKNSLSGVYKSSKWNLFRKVLEVLEVLKNLYGSLLE